MKQQKTVTRTQGVTNTKLAVATGAMIVALSSALAVLPGAQNNQQPTRSQIEASCAAVITASERECRLRSGSGYREHRYTCPDGRRFAMRSGCRTVTDAQRRANQVCLSRNRGRMCSMPANPAGAPAAQANAFPDIAFVGGVSFYTDQEGVSKAKLRYTNRGSVNLPNLPQRSYRLLVSGLDQNQQPVVNGAVESYPLYALDAGQVFDQVVTNLPEGVAFVKFELQIAVSPSDSEPKDEDLSNNVLMSSIPPKPFLSGYDPSVEQYADVIVSALDVSNGLLTLKLANQGNVGVLPLEDGVRIQLLGENDQVIRNITEPLPALPVGESTVLSFSVPPQATHLSLSIDPENLGNEPKLLSPNPMRDNNVLLAPVVGAPYVVWASDSPIGRASPGSNHLVGKLEISNTNSENVGVTISSVAFQVQSDIVVSEDEPRYIRFYRGGLDGEPILVTEFVPSQLRQEFVFERPLTLAPGGSETLFVTADTNDAVRPNYFSFRLAPKHGLRWTANDIESTFLNSPVHRFRTIAF